MIQKFAYLADFLQTFSDLLIFCLSRYWQCSIKLWNMKILNALTASVYVYIKKDIYLHIPCNLVQRMLNLAMYVNS